MLKATANWLAQVDYDIATAEQMLHVSRYIYVIFMSNMALARLYPFPQGLKPWEYKPLIVSDLHF